MRDKFTDPRPSNSKTYVLRLPSLRRRGRRKSKRVRRTLKSEREKRMSRERAIRPWDKGKEEDRVAH